MKMLAIYVKDKITPNSDDENLNIFASVANILLSKDTLAKGFMEDLKLCGLEVIFNDDAEEGDRFTLIDNK
jgi:hypothetical protein